MARTAAIEANAADMNIPSKAQVPAADPPASETGPRWPAAGAAAALVACGGLYLVLSTWSLGALLIVGVLLGITLHRGRFGFTGAYRDAFEQRDVGGIQAQLVMVGLATVLFAPLLAAGEAFGRPLTGAVAPAGVSVVLGSFMFGIGMQLGGGCGSGTLYSLGGGSARMALTLTAFCLGSFGATLHMDLWTAIPALPPVPLGAVLGWAPAVVLQLGLLLLLWRVAAIWGKPARMEAAPGRGRFRILIVAAIALALLNLATLLLAGHPWSITWAFSLWGAKAAMIAGWDPAGSAFWSAPFQARALNGSVLEDVTSVMNIGIVAGAFLSAALQRRDKGRPSLTVGAAATAIISGLLMGYGARIAYGCNIGAFFSGVASTSLHGWLWIAFALPGNFLAIRLMRRWQAAPETVPAHGGRPPSETTGEEKWKI